MEKKNKMDKEEWQIYPLNISAFLIMSDFFKYVLYFCFFQTLVVYNVICKYFYIWSICLLQMFYMI